MVGQNQMRRYLASPGSKPAGKLVLDNQQGCVSPRLRPLKYKNMFFLMGFVVGVKRRWDARCLRLSGAALCC